MLGKTAKAGVSAFDLRINETSAELSVGKGKEKVFERILEEEGIEVKRIRERGLYRLLLRVRARPFLAASCAVCILLFAFFHAFVYKTEISGNRLVNTSAIEKVVRAHDAHVFSFKKSVDLAGIQADVSALEGVSFASVSIKGNKLLIRVKEALPMENAEASDYDPVVSRYSAVVTKIVAESGTPQVKIGDSVERGTVLISPSYAFTEGSASAPAKGEIYGITTYEKRLILPEISVQSVLTGKKTSAREIYLFSRPVGKASVSPFPSFDLKEEVVFESFGGVLKVVEKTFFERQDVTVYHDFDLELPSVVERARAEILTSVPFYASAFSAVTVEQKKIDNTLYIVLYYTVEQRIDSLFAPEEGFGG